MAITPTQGGADFDIVPTGLHKARLVRVVDYGTQEVTYKDQIQHKHKVFMMWELPECLIKEGEFEGKPFSIVQTFTPSFHENSNLGPLLVGWKGRDFTQEEMDTFNIIDLLNETFLLNVIHNKSTDGKSTFANISALMPLAESECPARVGDLVAFDLSEFDQKVFDGLSEKMQAKIMLSSEWEFRHSGGGGEIDKAESRAKADANAEEELPVFDENGSVVEPEIDISEIGAEGKAELERSMINFKKEYDALPKKTWSAVTELCERKLGETDYTSFFKDNKYPHPGFIKDPQEQAKIGKELIAICKARE